MADRKIWEVEGKALPTAVVTRVTLSGSAVTLAAANDARESLTIYAEDADVYIKWGSGASATDYTLKITVGQTYELPTSNGIYTGIVTGFAASGDVQVTEA